jgi:hypothetical protein
MFKLYYFFGEDQEEFVYEIDHRDLLAALISMELIEYDFYEDYDDAYYFREYEDELLEYFYEQAYDLYLDELEYNKDPLAYYGMSRNDFF